MLRVAPVASRLWGLRAVPRSWWSAQVPAGPVAVLVLALWLLVHLTWPAPPARCPEMTQVKLVTWAGEAPAAAAGPACMCACDVDAVPRALRRPNASSAALAESAAFTGHQKLLARLLADLASLGIDETLLRRSLLYGGSGARWRRVLDRARAGETVRLAVIGGSISHGTTVEAGEVYGALVADWFRSAFPRANVVFVNGAVRAVPSAYFRFCVESQIGTDVDAVLWDFSVNDHDSEDSDIRRGAPFNERVSPRGTAEDEEILLRRVLAMPHEPAVAMFQFTNFDWTFVNAGDGQTVMATYYDVPSFGVKHVLYENADLRRRLMADPIHLNQLGHRLAAHLLVRFLLTLLDGEPPRVLPVHPPITAISVDPGAVGCHSIQGIHPQLRALAVDRGWAVETVQDKTYWRGTVPGGAVTFPLQTVAADTDVYLFALTAEYLSSEVDCTLDAGGPVRISGSAVPGPMRTVNWPGVNGGRKFLLGRAAAPGHHQVRCELVRGRDFRIIGILFSP